MKKKLALLIVSFLVLFFSAPAFAQQSEAVILYENDVHCAVDGYSKFSAFRQELEAKHGKVAAVSVGDFIQGDWYGAVSKGEYITGIMDIVGYDAVAPGNHEFDYGVTRLKELADMSKAPFVCCNFLDRENKHVFSPYTIVRCGDADVAFVGVITPSTNKSTRSAFYTRNGVVYYSFCSDNLFENVQKSIDAAKAAGADYVVALTHLGSGNVPEKWSSTELVKNTSGLSAVLDAHSHTVTEHRRITDRAGKEVVLSSTGSGFAYMGKLTLTPGRVTTELVSVEKYPRRDRAVDDFIAGINRENELNGQRAFAVSEVDLEVNSKDGKRIVRCRETNIGNLVADSYRIMTGACIGAMNGGGIKKGISAGNVTHLDIVNATPFRNNIYTAEITGRQLRDFLEFSVRNYPEESGSFYHFSGLTFSFDPSVPSPVQLDENGFFTGIDGKRRIRDIRILDPESGKYRKLRKSHMYSIASTDYLIESMGGGASMFADAVNKVNTGIADTDILEMYITECLGGKIGKEYADPQGRIKVIGE